MEVDSYTDTGFYCSLKTDIKTCQKDDELGSIYNRLFNASLGGRRSFHLYFFLLQSADISPIDN